MEKADDTLPRAANLPRIDWWKHMEANAVRVTCPYCDHVEFVYGKPEEIDDHVECHGCLSSRMDDSQSQEG